MAGIPEHIIDQVQDRIDIVEIVGGYIPLKKAGKNFRALCPFHHEKTPSFMVSQGKQIFRCFGCGAGGNVFNFVMKYERLEFPEAVRALAQKAGVTIPAYAKEAKSESSGMNKLYAAGELTVGYFQKNLRDPGVGKAAYEYLAKRGITEEAIKTFKLGFAPAKWDGLLNFAKQKGVTPDTLEQAGLAIARDEGGYFDRFRSRIMFTILDMKSRVLGFGGRVFQQGEDKGPKYMNSPETVIYNKRRILYGLNVTWKHIRDEDQVIIVEGYLDLIIPFQYGIRNIVASLGTSLTENQIRVFRRYTKNVVVIFDPDKAGEMATLRSLDLLIQEGLNVRIVRLPEGYDPDSFVRKYGPEEFRKRIARAKNLFEYKLSVLRSRHDASSLENKAKIVEEMLPTISRVHNAVLKSGYIKQLADALNIDEDAIRQELKKIKAPKEQSAAYTKKAWVKADDPQISKFRESEKILTGLLIDDNKNIHPVREKMHLDEFVNPIIRRIVGILYEYDDESKTITPGKLINHLEDAQAQRYIPELVDSVDAVVDKEKTLTDCIMKIKQANLKEKLNRLQVEIALAQSKDDENRINALITECNSLIRGIKAYEEKARETQKETVQD